jgi:hypothetical protein
MAVYDPNDPYNWAGIAADLAAKDKRNPDGTSFYEIDPTRDPEFAAFVAQYDYNRKKAVSDSELRRKKADDDYRTALDLLEQSGLTGRQNLDTSMLARGVFNSGETLTRRDELGKGLTQAKTRADSEYGNAVGTIDADREGALAGLGFDREREIVASKARIAAAQRMGRENDPRFNGGSGGAGARSTSPAAPPPASPPASSYVGGALGLGNANTVSSRPASNRPPAAPRPPVSNRPTTPTRPTKGRY